MARLTQTPQEFIECYLRAQDRFVKRHSYGYRFHKQHVLEILRNKSETVVTTSGLGPSKRRRYCVRKRDGSWNITSIELECCICSGTGKTPVEVYCDSCDGVGWRTI